MGVKPIFYQLSTVSELIFIFYFNQTIIQTDRSVMEVKLIFYQLFMVYESASRLLIPDLKRDHRWGKKLAASPL
jgi:hypothetical protein